MHRPSICAIFATDQQGGMGLEGRMPWPRLTKDLQLFQSRTFDNIIIMGRKTWLSKDMKNPLPRRTSAVWTQHNAASFPLPENVIRLRGAPDGCLDMLSSLLSYHRDSAEYGAIYVIGGAETLRAWMPLCEFVCHTEIHQAYGCDTVFRNSEWRDEFELRDKTLISNEAVPYAMTTWRRKGY